MNFLLGLGSKVYLIVIAFLVGLIVTLSVTNYFKIQKIESLQNDLMLEKAATQQERANNTVLKAQIDKQNSIIEQSKVDYDAKVKEFEEWKKEPIYITKIKEVKSDECEDIKTILDDIRNIAN